MVHFADITSLYYETNFGSGFLTDEMVVNRRSQ
jgi:hypothetical protein